MAGRRNVNSKAFRTPPRETANSPIAIPRKDPAREACIVRLRQYPLRYLLDAEKTLRRRRDEAKKREEEEKKRKAEEAERKRKEAAEHRRMEELTKAEQRRAALQAQISALHREEMRIAEQCASLEAAAPDQQRAAKRTAEEAGLDDAQPPLPTSPHPDDSVRLCSVEAREARQRQRHQLLKTFCKRPQPLLLNISASHRVLLALTQSSCRARQRIAKAEMETTERCALLLSQLRAQDRPSLRKEK